jgi:ApaG protein
MVTRVTQGIEISAQSTYRAEHSQPDAAHHFFSYRISITNTSEYTVQLLRRHWFIFDSCGLHQEVKGEGVIGQQPILEPGQHYEYESACTLTTEIGSMHGSYQFCKQIDGSLFEVSIPKFELITPFRQN